MTVPARLAAHCRKTAEGRVWLEQLPQITRELRRRWALSLSIPYEDASCAWVTPVRRADGTRAVLKIAMPHMEGEHEIAGLRFWNGDPTVRLLDADLRLGAMLLERCEPGTMLRDLPESDQDIILARLLRRLWRPAPAGYPFRPLSAMTAHWSAETLADSKRWKDPSLVHEGLLLFRQLPRTAAEHVVLATDLHAGNVLRSQREPWVVIDPKPFVGDPAYDATQHLFNCRGRLRNNPESLIRRFSDLLGVDRHRVRLWMFARAAAEPRDDWDDPFSIKLARALAS